MLTLFSYMYTVDICKSFYKIDFVYNQEINRTQHFQSLFYIVSFLYVK